jgi:aldose 1-epimerase
LLCALAVLALVTEPSASAPARASVVIDEWGRWTDGAVVRRYSLTNSTGMTLRLIDMGATLIAIELPDARGKAANVVIGPTKLEGYVSGSGSAGMTMGRYAGRLAGGFAIDGQTFKLAANAQGVTVHGGPGGMNTKVFAAREISTPRATGVEFTYRSPDGEQRFPGNLKVTVRYLMENKANRLRITWRAESDKPTVINLTNHAYFNLAGAGVNLCHVMQADAPRRVDLKDNALPSGALPDVAGGPLDFRKPTLMALRVKSSSPPLNGKGIDHMILFDKGGALRLWDPGGGRTMTMRTTQPGAQIYSWGATGRPPQFADAPAGAPKRIGAFAIEPQHIPDSPNIPSFPSTELRPGQVFEESATYTFDVDRFDGRPLSAAWRAAADPSCNPDP